jgi:membrane-associated phospholipid phosphatase
MGFAFVTLAWPVLRVFNHLAMTTNLPMQDALLAHWDAVLAFDWLGYARWIDNEHTLASLLAGFYTNLTTVSSFVFVVIVLAGDTAAAEEFIILFVMAAVLATSIGMLFPAFGAMAHFAPARGTLHFIPNGAGTWFVSPLRDVRTNPGHVFKISNLPGLTAFPSFHTAMGVIVLYCCRTRIWMCVVALVYVPAMIAAAVVWGGHYFVDIVAGAGLALGLIAILRWSKQSVIESRLCEVATTSVDDADGRRYVR